MKQISPHQKGFSSGQKHDRAMGAVKGARVKTAGRPSYLSWHTSHLPALSPGEMAAMLDLMKAWYHGLEWNPPAHGLGKSLFEHIKRHGLIGILGAMCVNGQVKDPHIIEMAKHPYISNEMRARQALAICRHLTLTCAELGMGLVVFKGPALSVQAYGDLGIRAFADIDLFARSGHAVRKLSQTLGTGLSMTSDRQTSFERMAEAEAMKLEFRDWELEFRYPVPQNQEPMFRLLEDHQADLFAPVSPGGSIVEPDPGLHFVFLIQHMAIHHLFSRFIWFLDLAALMRSQRHNIDLAACAAELKKTGLLNAASVAADFCRKYISEDFPRFEARLPAYNHALLQRITEPKIIAAGSYGIYHRGALATLRSYLLAFFSFQYVADPAGQRPGAAGFASAWVVSRIKHAFGWAPGFILGPASLLAAGAMGLGARLLCMLLKTHKKWTW